MQGSSLELLLIVESVYEILPIPRPFSKGYTEQNFPVVLSIVLHKRVLTFDRVTIQMKLLRLPYTFRGVLRPSDVARRV